MSNSYNTYEFPFRMPMPPNPFIIGIALPTNHRNPAGFLIRFSDNLDLHLSREPSRIPHSSSAFPEDVMVMDSVDSNQERMGAHEARRRVMIEERIVSRLETKIFKKHENNDDQEACSICLSDFEEKEKLIVLPCAHQYHKNCISNWFVRNTSCPLCRATAII